MIDSEAIKSAYQEAHNEILAVRHGERTPLRMLGADRLDLLNRMSTNEVDPMKVGTWKTTVLTNAVGRMIDHVILFSNAEEATLLTSEGWQDAVQKWLSGYVFFQDDVRFEAGNPFIHWSLLGAQVGELGEFPEIPEGQFQISESSTFWRSAPPSVSALEILADNRLDQELQSRFPSDEYAIDRQVYEIMRIESGSPAYGKDFDEDTIPLEAGLWGSVSFSKGCYIGQEIIARLESRGRLAKKLMGVRLDEPAYEGDELFQDRSRVGRLTSVSESPELGWIGLAMVRSIAADSDMTTVTVGRAGPAARLARLPITSIKEPA